jgi:hypothetical protein
MKSFHTTASGFEGNPIIHNEGADEVRFRIPKLPSFSIFPSILSILSLVILGSAGIYFYLEFKSQELWISLPFMFPIFGAWLGVFLELYLLLTGDPFLKVKNRFSIGIGRFRLLNLAPVLGSIFFLVCTLVVEDEGLRVALLLLTFFATVALGTVLYFGPPSPMTKMVILGSQIVQVVVILASGILFSPMKMVGLYLLLQSLVQGYSFNLGTNTPKTSTIFHLLGVLSGALLYLALVEALSFNPNIGASKAIDISSNVLLKWGVILACIYGVIFTMRRVPRTYNVLRSIISNWIWSFQYFILISAKRFPNPKNLSELYMGETPDSLRLIPYYQHHPDFLPESLSIPSVARLEKNVTAFGDLVKKAKGAFKLIALLDHFTPQANVNIPLKDKPRMRVWSDGSDIYPKIYTRKIFGFSLPIPNFKITPPPAIEAYKKGQLLAYLAESGIANPFLKKAPDRPGYLMMDFRHLENYETKPDYESYGGVAYFRVNSEKKCLELTSVIGPKDNKEILPNPMDASYRHAESMVTASMYFMVISGKHLAHIHMTYNLLEVVLHNAFDAHGEYAHPVRTFMYIHLFSHELAEELTTEHLIQDGAVFNQIFSTTHKSLINHLNDQYHSFEYAEDEDFEYRSEIMRMDNGEILPKACINWELEYVEIWRKYTDGIINAVYPHDSDVENDKCIQDMYRGMNQVFLNGLPGRYDELKTKKGLSRWASDTIHHLVVRHQVYGTSGINAALDPRISTSQVPKDGGTPGVNEWRALMGVALATACSRFTLLFGNDGENFVYLLENIKDLEVKQAMKTIFEELHDDMQTLDDKWKLDAEFNYNYFRAIPSDLRTGPGY